MRKVAAAESDVVAVATERLAVLLSAGISPAVAWRHLADSGAPHSSRAALAAAAALQGGDIRQAIAGGGGLGVDPADPATEDYWAALAATWRVAETSGAPVAASMRRLASSIRALGGVRRQADVALAGPAATARMVLVMPGIAVLLGVALGFDTLTTLLTTVPGVVCALAAGALIALGARWNRRMVAKAAPRDRAPGLLLELIAVAMGGGVSVARARRLVIESLPDRLTASPAEWAAADDILRLAAAAGVPAAALLRSEAEARRRQAVVEAERAAVSLSVRLMIPLGLCVLPAFLLVGVLPLLFSILSSTVGELV